MTEKSSFLGDNIYKVSVDKQDEGGWREVTFYSRSPEGHHKTVRLSAHAVLRMEEEDPYYSGEVVVTLPAGWYTPDGGTTYLPPNGQP